MEWIVIIGALMLLSSTRGRATMQQVYPGPGAGGTLAGDALGTIFGQASIGVGTPVISSALNGFGRPPFSGFGVVAGPPQVDVVYGDPGYGQNDLGSSMVTTLGTGGLDVGATVSSDFVTSY